MAAGTKETSANTEAVTKSSQKQLVSTENISYAEESLSRHLHTLTTMIKPNLLCVHGWLTFDLRLTFLLLMLIKNGTNLKE
ncbi:hypothetical protein ACH95_05990 [Bacillus glycinifermentans]|uniref:Uncharacterized protein n=1 Tax=Bacillus glycinifermentans TaxID=1664069 RepID=A0A0J6EIS7_9BACI|nr:hypothetical protein COP00_01875 [Bacillus glycinifermentans]KMM62317.1 hypothetical protein ACH95_05990 [Bacillus glycinifermentans]KRT93934.1 hypothetical protein AB447_216425 [Bacillus glycinifermentans]